LVRDLPAPRVVLLYVPHGDPTEQVCAELLGLLETGDIVADGGNSHWDDSRRRAARFAERGIHFLDVGTSGGIQGAREGACFMVGGDQGAFETIRPLLVDLAVDPVAVVHAGPSGSGHFAKIVHNAIEFGMVQAIGEGVELLSRSEFSYDLPALFENWSHGSVIRGWLVELMRDALAGQPDLAPLSTYVEDTQEVKWMLRWALDNDIPLPVTYEAQTALMEYRDLNWPAAKAVALLRHAYGGHPVHSASEPHRS
jgi:6-phosphogluconate dehydrogenase